MMFVWNGLVEFLEAGIFVVSQALGGHLGSAIVVVSLLVRGAMLPLTYRLARRARRHQAALAELRPHIDRVKKAHAGDAVRIAQESRDLFRRSGVRQIDAPSLLGSISQAPLLAGLFQAVRRATLGGGSFLWIGNIGRPDILLALLISGLVGIGMVAGGSGQHGAGIVRMILFSAVSLVFLVKMSSGLGLYVGTSSAVGLLQRGLLRREERRASMTEGSART